MMRRFVIRLFWFLIPVFVILFLILGIGAYLGDALPYSSVIETQKSTEPTLYSVMNASWVGSYKLESVRQRQPSLLFLGSSRIHTMGPFLVDDPALFYNAWMRNLDFNDALEFLQNLDSSQTPDVLIWSIDQRYFLAEVENTSQIFNQPPFDLQLMLKASITSELELARMILNRSPLLENEINGTEPSIGLNAVGYDARRGDVSLLNHGEAYIGSIGMTSFLNQDMERNHQGHRRAFESRTLQFVPGEEISPESLATVRSILEYAQLNNIFVIGFLPAFSPTASGWMLESGDFTYLEKIAPAVFPLFEEYGYPIFDFTDSTSIPLDPADFMDAYHLTPHGNTVLYSYLLEQLPDILGNYSTTAQIDTLLENTDDPFFLEYYASF